MNKRVLLLLACILCVNTIQAQFLKKMKDKVHSLTTARVDSTEEEEGPYETTNLKPVNENPSLIIGGNDQVQVDSVYEFDIAVYQETEAWQGNQRVIKGGEDVVIYYSSAAPQLGVHLISKSTGARYQFYADFAKGSQLSITAIHKIGSGTREKLDLQTMEPVYPGETGYLNQLVKTGDKKVIAGIVCEEYQANNARSDSGKVNITSRALIGARVWVPMQPHTLFPGYAFIPENYKDQIETMLIAGSYPPVAMPLEMLLEYSNGDKVITYTTDIVRGENRKIAVMDVIR
ncbi:hypothetical protein CLV51_103555 [Chitinophaga niastensis]|uniref:GLPGLI family protein n=1 Tax=Chitinophaga niastensis TaxID=536980 RepID=A0A2P8HK32_CHINA|nr:hypothetical protein [Chitinophaga niastensis]PSL46574.1 hypothetical protein CLV51_103555 [Chitinophaga niastensis]